MHDQVTLVFEPQPEGGFTVTSPSIPELITEGDTLGNLRDALAAVIDLYHDLGREFPPGLAIAEAESSVRAEMVLSVP